MNQLTVEQKAKLDNELTADPNGKGYAALRADKPGHVVDLLNAKTEWMHKSTWVTDLTLMDKLGVDAARSILTKLKNLAPGDIVIEKIVKRLEGKGMDIGNPESIKMIDALAEIPAPNGFTADEATALKGLSWQPATTMEVLELPFATEEILRSL